LANGRAVVMKRGRREVMTRMIADWRRSAIRQPLSGAQRG
jgi:hypothetical protein